MTDFKSGDRVRIRGPHATLVGIVADCGPFSPTVRVKWPHCESRLTPAMLEKVV